MCHVSRVTCHLSRVICHLSGVTCQVSPVTCQKIKIKNNNDYPLKKIGQSSEASQFRVCYQQGLTRLVYALIHNLTLNLFVLNSK